MFVTRLVTSSITAIASELGTELDLPSVLAAMAVKARAARSAVVILLIIGLLPMFKLKQRVDLSASLMASVNFLTLTSSADSTFLAAGAGALVFR
jgi:hypothetical protein